ncbi:MAG TPA: glycosyltransferase family 4 protein [Acidimicrobiales bacterium]|jgi:glycosyltransferase involved in cell wall biosynthesis
MRICHVIDYFHTDVGYQEFFLAREQASAGHDVRVVSSTHRQHTVSVSGPDEARGSAELRDAGVDLVRLPALQMGHDRAWLRGLGHAITAHRPDTVHVHGPFSPTTARAARVCNRHDIALLVDNHIQDSIAPASMTVLGRTVYAAFRLAFGPMLRRSVDAWVANGPSEASFLSERLGVPVERVELFPLAFDPAAFHYDEERRTKVRAARRWEDDLVVAVTGKLHPGKRVEVVAAAAEQLSRSDHVRLVIAGSIEPDYATTVKQAAPRLDGDGRVEIRPMLAQRELADLYLASDVVVFARLPSISIYEATGTGARVLVGDGAFGRWLHSISEVVEPVALPDLADHLSRVDQRGERSASAADVLGWPAVSAAFVARYERLRCAS